MNDIPHKIPGDPMKPEKRPHESPLAGERFSPEAKTREQYDEINTIDRHLEAIGNLRVVVCLPFIAGHKEHLTSSIWGFQNTQYHDMFKASEEKLNSLLGEHENA